MQNSNPSELSAQIQQITDSLDSGAAQRFLEKFQEDDVVGISENARIALVLTAFPDLPDEQAAFVIENYVLRFYSLDIPFQNRLETRYVFAGTIAKNKQRIIFKEAILKNKEQLGPLTIGGWLEEYGSEYPENTRSERALIDFSLKNKHVSSLSKTQVAVLKDILRIYDDWIAFELVDVFDVIAFDNELNNEGESSQDRVSGQIVRSYQPNPEAMKRALSQETVSESTARPVPISVENLPLQKAFQKYPRIISQTITGSKIMLRGSRERVPGTLKNWITSYQQDAGPAPHEPFERSQFLFHNQNASALSQEERNALSGILQAFDENTPIPIDSGVQKIALDKIEGEIGTREPEPSNRNAEPEKKPILSGGAARSAGAKEKMSFSERGPERYESIRQSAGAPFSGNAKETPQENEVPRDAEMTKEVKGEASHGQVQGTRMRGDAGVIRPSESVGEDEEISGSFIDKIARQQRQLQKAQSDLQEFGVREKRGAVDARRNDTSPQKGGAVHDFNQKETRENSLQGQFQNREAQFYKGLKTSSMKAPATEDSTRQKKSLHRSAGKLSQREGTPGRPSGKFRPGAAGSREDFTDYYPIPKKKKSVAKMRFTERQRFGGEVERRNGSIHAAKTMPARSVGAPVSPDAKQKSESEGPQNGLIIE